MKHRKELCLNMEHVYILCEREIYFFNIDTSTSYLLAPVKLWQLPSWKYNNDVHLYELRFEFVVVLSGYSGTIKYWCTGICHSVQHTCVCVLELLARACIDELKSRLWNRVVIPSFVCRNKNCYCRHQHHVIAVILWRHIFLLSRDRWLLDSQYFVSLFSFFPRFWDGSIFTHCGEPSIDRFSGSKTDKFWAL